MKGGERGQLLKPDKTISAGGAVESIVIRIDQGQVAGGNAGIDRGGLLNGLIEYLRREEVLGPRADQIPIRLDVCEPTKPSEQEPVRWMPVHTTILNGLGKTACVRQLREQAEAFNHRAGRRIGQNREFVHGEGDAVHGAQSASAGTGGQAR